MTKRTFRAEFDALVPTIGVAELLAEACRDVPICADARKHMSALERMWSQANAAQMRADAAEGRIKDLCGDWKRVEALRAEAQDLRKKADQVAGRGAARELDDKAGAKDAQAAELSGRIDEAIRDIAETQASAARLHLHWVREVGFFLRRYLAPAAAKLVARGASAEIAEAERAGVIERFQGDEAGEMAVARFVETLTGALRGPSS